MSKVRQLLLHSIINTVASLFMATSCVTLHGTTSQPLSTIPNIGSFIQRWQIPIPLHARFASAIASCLEPVALRKMLDSNVCPAMICNAEAMIDDFRHRNAAVASTVAGKRNNDWTATMQ